MKRLLYLDEDADNWITNLNSDLIRVVTSSNDVKDLYRLSTMGAVFLDCRKLSYQTLFQLLPFIEEHQGDITMLGKGILPRPILSRFSYKKPVEKTEDGAMEAKVTSFKSLDEFIGSTITEELLEEITTAIKNEILSEIQCVIDSNVKENTVSVKVTSGS